MVGLFIFVKCLSQKSEIGGFINETKIQKR